MVDFFTPQGKPHSLYTYLLTGIFWGGPPPLTCTGPNFASRTSPESFFVRLAATFPYTGYHLWDWCSESARRCATTALLFFCIVVAQLRAVLSTCEADSCSLDGIGVIGIFRSAVLIALVEVYLLPFSHLDAPSFAPWWRPFQAEGKTQQL